MAKNNPSVSAPPCPRDGSSWCGCGGIPSPRDEAVTVAAESSSGNPSSTVRVRACCCIRRAGSDPRCDEADS
jgi:hypothetical protein